MRGVAGIKRHWGELRRQPKGLRAAYVRGTLDWRLPLQRAPLALTRLTGAGSAEVAGFLDEVPEDGPVVSHVREEQEAWSREIGRPAPSGILPLAEGRVLYALVRLIRPEVVVETGTANGSSTTFLLAGLEANGSGRMLSIDLPFYQGADRIEGFVEGTTIDDFQFTPVAPGREPGWLVPAHLRHRWELRLGDARELLPPALDELGEIGLFFHDSLHTEEHMRFEFEHAWRRLAAGGVLASDDVFFHGAATFATFARSVGRPFTSFRRLGFIRKR